MEIYKYIKRLRYLVAFVFLFFSFLIINSCGGGAGSDYTPEGNDPGVPHTLQFYTWKNVAQTGTYVLLEAYLIDGNHKGIAGKVVNFTNKSLTGKLYPATIEASATTTAVTNSEGIASVRIRSTTAGFANVVVEHAGLRDMRSIYFTSSDVLGSFNPVSVVLDVDGDGDGIYNETEDFNLFEFPGDDTVLVRATVTVFGQAVSGVSVTFTTDNLPDASFPGGTDTDEDDIPDQKTTSTDSSGQAYVTVKVTPSAIITSTVVMNVQAATGSFYVPEFDAYFSGAGMVSLFLEPVIVDLIDLYAKPDVVEVEKDSDLTIGVRLNTGDPAPDGTTVQLTIDNPPCGSIDTPFVQTTDGNATAKFTAPSTVPAGDICTVKATVGSAEATVDITVVETAVALSILPESAAITNPTVGDTFDFLVIGGAAPYSAISSNPSLVTVSVAGTTVTATVIAVPAADTDVTITVMDNAGDTVTATLTLDVP